MRKRVNLHDLNVSQRKDRNTQAKQMIASKAMKLIKDDDMVFLDISTANLELARLIVKSTLNIIVVTNMVDIMLEFMVPTVSRLIMLGGSFSSGRDGFTGSLTDRQLEDFRFDLAFMEQLVLMSLITVSPPIWWRMGLPKSGPEQKQSCIHDVGNQEI